MSDKPEEPARRGFPWGVTLLIALPVLYALSFGPATYFCFHLGYGDAYESFYAPVLKCYDLPTVGDAIREIMMRYVFIWFRLLDGN